MSNANGRSAAVIGAGLGGIGAAVSLAAAGWRVDLFEKNDHVGGKLNVLREQGFAFDLGPSILTLPAIFERLYARAGRRFADDVPIQALQPHWRNFFEDGTSIDLHPTAAETVRASPTLGPDDGRDLESFLAYSRRLYDLCEPSYFGRGLETTWQMVRHHGVLSALRDFDLFDSMHDGVASHVRHPRLRDVLDFFVKYVGSSAYDAPGILNLMAHVQSAFGLWYVPGGLFRLALGLRRLAEEAGVRLHLGTEVAGIREEAGRAAGIRLADGSTHDADVVVCNMEVIPAYRRLLGEPEERLQRFDRFGPACSGLVLHLGVRRTYPRLAHHNFFFSRDPESHFHAVFREHRLPEDPTIYLVAPARTDPTQAPEGCESIKILPHIPYVQDPPFPRSAYLELKQRVLDKLERMGLEGLRRHTVVEQMWVPEDIERLYYSNRGAIYGVVSDRRTNRGFKAPRQSDRLPNLWFAGGSVNPGGGMPMALLSGMLAADRILGAPDGPAAAGEAC